MNLDTTQLRGRIKDKISQTQKRIAAVNDELARLEKERPRLQAALGTIEALERIAGEFDETADKVQTSHGSPPESILEKPWGKTWGRDASSLLDEPSELQQDSPTSDESSIDRKSQAAKYPQGEQPIENYPYFAQWG